MRGDVSIIGEIDLFPWSHLPEIRRARAEIERIEPQKRERERKTIETSKSDLHRSLYAY